jgi:hypothetical protein
MIKYQIFISSTYDDLKSERNQVIKAVLEMGHIPVGMEMFSAADEEQWKIISRQIDESDYYVVIVGHRYGSMSGSVSYTEKEFDYALSKGVPIYGFVVDESVEPLAKNVDKDKVRTIALSKFKSKVLQRPVGFWKNADDLHGKVSIALMKAFNTNPRLGWTRAHSAGGPEISMELSRLSKENSELREQVAKAKDQDAIDRRAQLEKEADVMKSVVWPINIREKGQKTWDLKVEKNLFEIFSQISTEIMDEQSVDEISEYLAIMNIPQDKTFSGEAPVPINQVRMLLGDLASLDLVCPSKKKHAVSDKHEYWSLTDQGRELLKVARVNALYAAAAKEMSKKQVK